MSLRPELVYQIAAPLCGPDGPQRAAHHDGPTANGSLADSGMAETLTTGDLLMEAVPYPAPVVGYHAHPREPPLIMTLWRSAWSPPNGQPLDLLTISISRRDPRGWAR